MSFPQGYTPPPGVMPQGAPQPQRQKPEPISQADAALLGAQLEYDPAVDANASIPPVLPTDALKGPNYYVVTAEFAEPSPHILKAFTRETKQSYFNVPLTLTVTECTAKAEMVGRKMRYDARTLVSQYNRTSQAQGLIQATHLKDSLLTMPRTPHTLIALVSQIVQQKIPFRVTVDWRAYDSETNTNVARSWKQFPTDTSGEPIPIMTVTNQMGTKEYRAQVDVSPITYGTSTGPATAAAVPAFDPGAFTSQPMPQTVPPIPTSQPFGPPAPQTQPQPQQQQAFDFQSLFGTK